MRLVVQVDKLVSATRRNVDAGFVGIVSISPSQKADSPHSASTRLDILLKLMCFWVQVLGSAGTLVLTNLS